MTSVVCRALMILSVCVSAAIISCGQDRTPPVIEKTESLRTRVDETVLLNIADRHINEQNFEASTSVGFATADRNNVRLQVGVALRAQTIDVSLHNITGTVRFRGSVQRVLDLVNGHAKAPSP